MYLLRVPKEVFNTPLFKSTTFATATKNSQGQCEKRHDFVEFMETKKGSTQLTRGFSWPKCFFGFCFSKTAAVAEREEFASFLPSLPSASIFPKGKKKKIIPEPAADWESHRCVTVGLDAGRVFPQPAWQSSALGWLRGQPGFCGLCEIF